MNWIVLTFAAGVVLAAARFGGLTLVAAADRGASLQSRSRNSAKTLVACAIGAGAVWLGLRALPDVYLGTSDELLAWLGLGSLAGAFAFVVLGRMATRTDQTSYTGLIRTLANSGWSKARQLATGIAGAAVNSPPIPTVNKAARAGNRVLIVGAAAALALLAINVMIYSNDVKPAGAMREYLFVSLSVILLSSTVPVLVTWFVVSLISGRPQFGTLLRQASDTVGCGLVVGLLCGVVAFWLNMVLAGRPLQDPSSFSFDVVIGTSIFGSIVGFGFAHLRVLRGMGRGFSNRAAGAFLSAGVAIAVAAALTFAAPPRLIGGRLIDALTEGVSVPEGVAATPMSSDDWRVAIAAGREQIVSTLPTPEGFLLWFAIVVVVAVAFGLVVDAVRSLRRAEVTGA